GGGITKLHQPASFQESWMVASQRSGTTNVLELQSASAVAKLMLEHATPWASGVSGTTNVNLFALKYFQEKGAQIDTKHFLLGVAMLLVYDGGHSFQEVLWTANQLDHKMKLGLGLTDRDDPDSFIADYDKFAKLFEGTNSARSFNQALGDAK